MRTEILRVSGIITGAKGMTVDEQNLIAASSIDLGKLHDRKKYWDDNFGLGDGIARPINSVRRQCRTRLAVAISAILPLPRPTLSVVLDVQDENVDEKGLDQEDILYRTMGKVLRSRNDKE